MKQQHSKKRKSGPPLSASDTQQRKHHVLSHRAASSPESIAQALNIKDEDIFFVADSNSQVPLEGLHGFGLYYHDCRFLNGYLIEIYGRQPEHLATNASEEFKAGFQLVCPALDGNHGAHIRKEELALNSHGLFMLRNCLPTTRSAFRTTASRTRSLTCSSRSGPVSRTCLRCEGFSRNTSKCRSCRSTFGQDPALAAHAVFPDGLLCSGVA